MRGQSSMAEYWAVSVEEDKTEAKSVLELSEKIASFINFSNWHHFGIHLGLEEHELQNIDFEYVQRKPNILEVCYQLLNRWKQKCPKDFSEKRLTETMEKLKIYGQITKISCQVSTKILSTAKLKIIRTKVECLQKNEYKGRPMPVPPWMEERNLPLKELYVDLDMFPTDKVGNELEEISIPLENIFDPVNDKDQPTRILVEADAGYGKTTLVQKIVEDWTQETPYVFDKFRMIFFFYLRNCTSGDKFENLIREECQALGVDGENGLQCVKCFKSETLFILDGYDELGERTKINFDNLLRKKEFRTSTVVVTSRRGVIKIEKENPNAKGLTRKKETGGDRLNFWDKRILIKGIAPKNRLIFLENFFQCKIKDEWFQKISSLVNLELYRCPLFLILLATLRDEENTNNLQTQTTLFQFLINVVTRRGLIREGLIKDEENVELFDPDHPNFNIECAQQMTQFGKLALDHLIQDKLTFSQAEMEACCGDKAVFPKLGFLNRHVTFDNRRFKGCYEPIHKSILEFFIAFYLFQLAKNPNPVDRKLFKAEIENLMKYDQNPGDSSPIYPFVAGLLEDQSYILFKALSPFRMFYRVAPNTARHLNLTKK